jgi:hypothetical protein
MTKLNDDANIEALLRADAINFQNEHVANDGFSDSVTASVAALPSTGHTAMLAPKQRLMIITSATLLAVVIAVTAGAGGQFLIDATMDLATKTITPTVLALGVLMLAACAMAVSAARSE